MLRLARLRAGSPACPSLASFSSSFSLSASIARSARASHWSAQSLAGGLPPQRQVRALPHPSRNLHSRSIYSPICNNCRLAGHPREACTAPTICVACGVEGHERKDCPNPDPSRLEALKTSLTCFRCGAEGHVMKKCPQPVKCFGCGQEGHLHKNCPTSPLKPRPKAKKPAAPQSEPAAAVADATIAA